MTNISMIVGDPADVGDVVLLLPLFAVKAKNGVLDSFA